MGVLTTIDQDIDRDAGVHRIFAITDFGINNRSTLNRIAGRASLMCGVGQRTLVAAAYKEEGIDLVWNKGLGATVAPEEKFTDAKRIDYSSMTIEEASNLSDIMDILPTNIRERIEFGEFRMPLDEKTLHIWEIPLGMSSR